MFLFEQILVVEPTANSYFQEQESPIFTAGKNNCITDRLNDIYQLLWCYICIQFELVEVARVFLLWPGNEVKLTQVLTGTVVSIEVLQLRLKTKCCDAGSHLSGEISGV